MAILANQEGILAMLMTLLYRYWPSFINAVYTKILAYTEIPTKLVIYYRILTLTLNLGRIKSHASS